MARVSRQTITVSPPNLDRTGFLTLETWLGGSDGPSSRDWLLDRLKDGFQLRMLRDPRRGFIEFAPGRASWWPIEGAEHCVVVQRLRVEPGPGAIEDARVLLREAEDWARYFGFTALLANVDRDAGPGSEAELKALGLQVIDEIAEGELLCMHALYGPMALPRLPRNWRLRARSLGRGLVVQDTGHCPDQTQRAETLLARAREAGFPARIDSLTDAASARRQLAAPGTLFCVVLDGQVIDRGRGATDPIWQEICRRREI